MTARTSKRRRPPGSTWPAGTLDIWPLYLFHPGRGHRQRRHRPSGVVPRRDRSRRRAHRVQGHPAEGGRAATSSEVLGGGELSLVAHILRALDIERGVKVVTQSRVPSGSGLGGSSALSVAVAAALCAAFDRKIDPDALWPVVRDAEAQTIGVPTGVQDYLAAIHGGVLGIHLEPGELRVEKLATDPARWRRACSSSTPASATSPASTTGRSSRARSTGRRTSAPAWARSRPPPGCARGPGDRALRRRGLVHGRRDAVARAAGPGRLVAGDRIASAEAAASAGGAAKVCGAGGGGMVSVWATPGKRAGRRGRRCRPRASSRSRSGSTCAVSTSTARLGPTCRPVCNPFIMRVSVCRRRTA